MAPTYGLRYGTTQQVLLCTQACNFLLYSYPKNLLSVRSRSCNWSRDSCPKGCAVGKRMAWALDTGCLLPGGASHVQRPGAK